VVRVSKQKKPPARRGHINLSELVEMCQDLHDDMPPQRPQRYRMPDIKPGDTIGGSVWPRDAFGKSGEKSKSR
jgi:hypothetical protein